MVFCVASASAGEECGDTGQDGSHERYSHRAEQPLLALVAGSDVGLQILRAGDDPRIGAPHPVFIDKETVDEAHDEQDCRYLPESRQEPSNAVDCINADQRVNDVAGNTDCFENRAAALDSLGRGQPQLHASFPHYGRVKIHHIHRAFADTDDANQNQQCAQNEPFQDDS